jgi:hypothetical protein
VEWESPLLQLTGMGLYPFGHNSGSVKLNFTVLILLAEFLIKLYHVYAGHR